MLEIEVNLLKQFFLQAVLGGYSLLSGHLSIAW